MMLLDMSTGNQDASASSPLSVNTTYLLNSPNLKEMSKKSAIDAFNESIGDGSNGERILAGDRTEKVSIINDIRHYREAVSRFNLKNKADESSSLKFWASNGRNFPMLSKAMKKLLCTPATSVPSENAFSLSAFLGRKERARLTEDNLSSSVFLKDKVVL